MLIQFKKIIDKYNIINKSIELFWKSFINYKNDNVEEFNEHFNDYNENKLAIYKNSVAYKIGDWPECSHEYIVIDINIIYNI